MPTSAVPTSSTTPPPRAPSSPSLAASPTNGYPTGSESTLSAPDQVRSLIPQGLPSPANRQFFTVWTPLVVSTMDEEAQKHFTSPMGRPGQPSEVATNFVFLASQDSSLISGQSLHPNGGVVVNG